MVVDVSELLGLRGARLDDLPHAVAETGDHRSAGARVEDLAAVGEIEANAVAPLDVRVGEIEQAREDVRIVRANRRRGHARLFATGLRRMATRSARTLVSLFDTCSPAATSAESGSRASIASKIASCSPDSRRCHVSLSGSRLKASFSSSRICSIDRAR